MFVRGTGRSLVVGGNRGVGSRDRLVGDGRGGFVCCGGVSGLIFCQTWQCSRGRIDTDGDKGVRVELGEDMGGSGGWWQVWPVYRGGARGICMVTIGQFDC